MFSTKWIEKAFLYVERAAAAEAKAGALELQLAVQQANFQWLSLRVNQLEHERAQLLDRLGVGIAVPTIGYQPPSPPTSAASPIPPLDPTKLGLDRNPFDDFTDEEAAVLGIPTRPVGREAPV